MINWDSYKYSNPTMKPNKKLIPVNGFGFNEKGINEFNEIYVWAWEQYKAGLMRKFIITKSGGFSIALGNIRGPMFHLWVGKSLIELIIRHPENARYYRFHIGYQKDKNDGMCGSKAFKVYREELLKDDVDIMDLAIDNGLEVKETIPKQKIDLTEKTVPERTYYNVHHIDLNSAYNAGMCESFPILRKSVERMYSKRSENNDLFKSVLNMTQGYMQSALVGYSLSHISKAGYEWTNNQLDIMADKITKSGGRVLSFNADGIWYQKEEPYTDSTFGPDLGQWKTDWTDCKIRYKSKGCYEVEGYKLKNGVRTYKYAPVFRGESSYEMIKPKDQWVWGDIFKGELKEYYFREGKGLVKC